MEYLHRRKRLGRGNFKTGRNNNVKSRSKKLLTQKPSLKLNPHIGIALVFAIKCELNAVAVKQFFPVPLLTEQRITDIDSQLHRITGDMQREFRAVPADTPECAPIGIHPARIPLQKRSVLPDQRKRAVNAVRSARFQRGTVRDE